MPPSYLIFLASSLESTTFPKSPSCCCWFFFENNIYKPRSWLLDMFVASRLSLLLNLSSNRGWNVCILVYVCKHIYITFCIYMVVKNDTFDSNLSRTRFPLVFPFSFSPFFLFLTSFYNREKPGSHYLAIYLPV